MNCKCWQNTQEELKKHNLKMVGATYLMPEFLLVPTIKTEWIDASKAPKGLKSRPTQILSGYCPFCGSKIDKNKGEAEL